MDLYDEIAPCYIPDYDLSASTLDTDSSSDRTMSTLSSGEAAEYFHVVHGFRFPVDENLPSVYPLVPNAVQIDHLIHAVMRLSHDGKNVPPEVDRMLQADTLSGQPGGTRILDVFTSSGAWVKEMAEQYPNATFLSIDVKPLTAHSPHPRITFEVYDFYAGIAEPDSSFDLVYAQNCVLATKNFNFILREMHRVLKPNGMLVITDSPFCTYDGDDPSKEISTLSNYSASLSLLRQALESQGIDLKVWEDLSSRLSPEHPLWNERSVDPSVGISEPLKTSGPVRGFHNIKLRVRLIPYGAWPEDEGQRIIGLMFRFLASELWSSFAPILLMMGMNQSEAQEVTDKAKAYVMDVNTRGTTKCNRWSAQKL